MRNRTGVICVLKTLLFALVVMSVCCLAHASDNNWSWGFGGMLAGVSPSASDGFDTSDRLLTDSRGTYWGTYHESGIGGWSGSTGFYWVDHRAPLKWTYTYMGNNIVLRTGESKTWTFDFWWDQSNPNGIAEVYFFNIYNPAPDVKYTLTYVRAPLGTINGQGVCSVAVGTSIDVQQASGIRWDFPAYATADGRTGYEFQFTATLVPEPSSLLPLLAGLGGLGAMLRRKRS